MGIRFWSSLPFDLLHRIAGFFLDTADLDYYMNFRAVCGNWRAATDDPRNTLDSRFRPHNWVVLVYPSHGEDTTRLLVNTATGRCHSKELPLLRNYYFVSVTADGLLVLAGRASPHAACVVIPFTGYMVQFSAPMRPLVIAAAVSSGGSSPPSLVVFCRHDSDKIYTATPESKCFARYIREGVSIDGDECVLPPAPLPAAVVAKISYLMTPFMDIPYMCIPSLRNCFLVESDGELLFLVKCLNRMEVYNTGMGRNMFEPVNCIGNRAIFISSFDMGISVDADNFPSIEANCIYLLDHQRSPYVDMYLLKDEGKFIKSSSTDLPLFICDPLAGHPMTIIELLLFTLNIPSTEYAWLHIMNEEYIFYDLRGAFRTS